MRVSRTAEEIVFPAKTNGPSWVAFGSVLTHGAVVVSVLYSAIMGIDYYLTPLSKTPNEYGGHDYAALECIDLTRNRDVIDSHWFETVLSWNWLGEQDSLSTGDGYLDIVYGEKHPDYRWKYDADLPVDPLSTVGELTARFAETPSERNTAKFDQLRAYPPDTPVLVHWS